jgi:hypothetical protein
MHLNVVSLEGRLFMPNLPGECPRLGLEALDSGGSWFEYKSKLFDRVSIITHFFKSSRLKLESSSFSNYGFRVLLTASSIYCIFKLNTAHLLIACKQKVKL